MIVRGSLSSAIDIPVSAGYLFVVDHREHGHTLPHVPLQVRENVEICRVKVRTPPVQGRRYIDEL